MTRTGQVLQCVQRDAKLKPKGEIAFIVQPALHATGGRVKMHAQVLDIAFVYDHLGKQGAIERFARQNFEAGLESGQTLFADKHLG